MFRLFLWLPGILVLWGCSSRKADEKANAVKPLNLLVLLDLSDRLLTPGQVTRDTQLLRHIYHGFENRVRRQFFINSKDRLQLLVAPQRSLPGVIERIEGKLRIYMPEVPIKERASYLRKQEATFFQQVDSLYTRALGNRNASSFSGSDIWKFFDQYLRNYLVLDTGTNNQVIVLTDGYFDFESLKDKKQTGCRYSYSEAIMRQARTGKTVYQQLFDSCGLLPVALNRPNVSVLVAEISPKNAYEQEAQLLEALWQSWIKTMRIAPSVVVQKSELQEVKNKVTQLLQ